MLSSEDNELLCKVGPGTPGGALVREYWLPALMSSELPKPDGDPMRLRLLGENLIAFRDTAGRVGLVRNACPHRGASLFFGRNEGHGLRCVYHGWKFDVTGKCMEMPLEPPESDYKDKVRAKAYPTHERGGIVWAYMGERTTPPPLPELEATQLDETEITLAMRACNWVQGMEADLDTGHVAFLHWGSVRLQDTRPGSFAYYAVKEPTPRYKVVDTDYGTLYGAYRPADNYQTYWRIAHFLFPCWTLAPFIPFEHYRIARAWVPLDDTHTMFVMIGPKEGAGSSRQTIPLLPNTTDWLGRFRSVQNAENDYLIDRELQRKTSFTGIDCIHVQDQAVTESMGEITDHAFENLAASDRMIAITRRRLLLAAKALAEENAAPPGAATPEAYGRVGAGYFVAPKSRPWPDVYRQQMATLSGDNATVAAE